MLLKKTVNTDRLIHTGSESLEIQHLAHKNQNMDRYTLNVYHKFQEWLEFNDWNVYVCQPSGYNKNKNWLTGLF